MSVLIHIGELQSIIGQRIPQESFGLELLRGMDGTKVAPDAAWTAAARLGYWQEAPASRH